jgi:hypothetical protein
VEELLGACGLEVFEDEPARGQGARRTWGERDGGQDEDDPGGDDPPAAANDEAPEAIEGHAWIRSAGAGRPDGAQNMHMAGSRLRRIGSACRNDHRGSS